MSIESSDNLGYAWLALVQSQNNRAANDAIEGYKEQAAQRQAERRKEAAEAIKEMFAISGISEGEQ